MFKKFLLSLVASVILFSIIICAYYLLIRRQNSLPATIESSISLPESTATHPFDPTITTYKGNTGISFNYPVRWTEPSVHQNTSTKINYNDPYVSGLEEITKEQKEHIVEIGQISVGFSNYDSDPRVCPNSFDCGVSISLIPYDNTKYLLLNCYEGSCWITDNLIDKKADVTKRSNFKMLGFPALLEDNITFLGAPSRTISFFTSKYYVTLNIYFSDDDIRLVDLDGVDLTKQIELIKTLERSRNATELKSVLQEFMNMVNSFEIK